MARFPEWPIIHDRFEVAAPLTQRHRPSTDRIGLAGGRRQNGSGDQDQQRAQIRIAGLGGAAKPRLALGISTLRVVLVAIALGLVLAQLGCATSSGNPPYPAGWASIKSAPTPEGCPDLQGTYSNQGAASFPPQAGEAPSLADIFMAMAHSKSATGPATWKRSWPTIPGDSAWVSIQQAPDSMTVTFIDSTGRLTPLSFRRYRLALSEDRVDDLFSCRTLYDEPTLRFFNEPLSHTRVSILAIGGGGTNVNLLKSVDGSLVVNWRSDDVTVSRFVLGSDYHVDNLWYRYSRLAAELPGEK